jgi:hypothetical protein
MNEFSVALTIMIIRYLFKVINNLLLCSTVYRKKKFGKDFLQKKLKPILLNIFVNQYVKKSELSSL